MTTPRQQLLRNHSYACKDDVRTAWSAGRDAGDGYGAGDTTMTPAEAAEAEGYEILSEMDDDHLIVAADGDRVIAIGDVYGPWAVDITDSLILD